MTTVLGEGAPLAVILAGGRSIRMQANGLSGDKCLHRLDDHSILDHIIERLNVQSLRPVLNANGDPQRFSQFGIPVIADCIGEQAGPLAGILTAMRIAQKQDFVMTVAADTPFFARDMERRLRECQSDTGADVVLCSSDGEIHPTFGLWRTSLADKLETWLSRGEKASIRRFAASLHQSDLAFPLQQLHTGEWFDPFFNINTPDELAKARQVQQVMNS